jgi:23S rRNA G2445 N2-methylase RlmL
LFKQLHFQFKKQFTVIQGQLRTSVQVVLDAKYAITKDFSTIYGKRVNASIADFKIVNADADKCLAAVKLPASGK